MKKITLQFFIIVFSFFFTWFLLSKADWMQIFHVKEITKTTEEKIGDLIWEVQKSDGDVINDKKIINTIDSILIRICKANGINRDQIKLHLMKSDEINAFALPNRHLIINSQLIMDCENPEELSGVLAHELAHMELHHVMKKLVEEIGLSALLSVTNGKDIKVIKNMAGTLSSSAYSRNLEQEADLRAIDYLVQSNIHPKYLANFLFRLSDTKSAASNYLSWISTHPESEERAGYLIKSVEDKKIVEEPVLTEEVWRKLKEDIKEK